MNFFKEWCVGNEDTHLNFKCEFPRQELLIYRSNKYCIKLDEFLLYNFTKLKYYVFSPDCPINRTSN